MRRKQKNVIDAQSVKLKAKIEAQREERERQDKGKKGSKNREEGEKRVEREDKNIVSALGRFNKSVKK